MATTYDKIATTTLGSATNTITFSAIAATWTDLRLVVVGTASANLYTRMQFNGDTASNYSHTQISGNGTTAASERSTAAIYIWFNNNYFINSGGTGLWTADIFSYTGSTNKTVLTTSSQDTNGSGTTLNAVGLWRSTSAITSVTFLSSSNLNIGTTATLYGILKA